MLKVSFTGTILWQSIYNASTDDRVYAVVPTRSGIYLAGETSDRTWITHIQPDGAVDWSRLIDNTEAWLDVAFDAAAVDDDVLLAGYTFYTHLSTEPPSHDYDFWVLRVNAAGEVVWDRAIGGESAEWGEAIAPHPNGNYVVAGRSSSFVGTNLEPGSWIVEVTPDGAVDSACTHTSVLDVEAITLTRTTPSVTFTASSVTNAVVTSSVASSIVACSPAACVAP